MLFRSIAALALFVLSSVAYAQGKIAVVNLEQAILQTDFAQQQLEDFNSLRHCLVPIRNITSRNEGVKYASRSSC